MFHRPMATVNWSAFALHRTFAKMKSTHGAINAVMTV